MSSLKARMVALKKGMGIGAADIKGTKLPHAAAATDAGAIQQHLALVIHVCCISLSPMRLLPKGQMAPLCYTLFSHTVLSHCLHTLFTHNFCTHCSHILFSHVVLMMSHRTLYLC